MPRFPAPYAGSDLEERTYKRLIGRLGEKAAVWAQCLFADPVSDLAVLGAPDGQALFEECEAYEALTNAGLPLPIVLAPNAGGAALVLSLDGEWKPCTVEHVDGPLFIKGDAIEGGMSGSPIINEDGAAFGVIATGGCDMAGPNPNLSYHLPRWMAFPKAHRKRR